MMQLKRMASTDIPTVVPLFLEASQTRYWEDGTAHDRGSASRMLEGYFQLPSYHWMVNWATKRAGYGHLLRSDYLESWIVSYLVAPAFQGRGIATAFVREAQDFARREGIETIHAAVHPENPASIRVIEKSGFRAVDPSTNSELRLYQWPP